MRISQGVNVDKMKSEVDADSDHGWRMGMGEVRVTGTALRGCISMDQSE